MSSDQANNLKVIIYGGVDSVSKYIQCILLKRTCTYPVRSHSWYVHIYGLFQARYVHVPYQSRGIFLLPT
jgi:hypothetical protein